MNSREQATIEQTLLQNRKIESTRFFEPKIEHLHDPKLMPDMEKAVARIIHARKNTERIVIFGDYDVDGVSSTALLFRFLSEIGCEVSYRLPHRVHDGYWLKKYFFDELKEKNVKLVITVDCGTRDIEPIHHATTLGIDVIVTDHHAVPEIIPDDLIALLNPKRKDSKYPFSGLAGAGVAFKLLQGMLYEMRNIGLQQKETEEQKEWEEQAWIARCISLCDESKLEKKLLEYIDLASLGTVADCMPLVDENRIITSLGLKQMKTSKSSALRKYIEHLDRDIEGDADVIWFQIGPRINAAGRMDSPLKALHWLLSDESRVDDWLYEVELLNTQRQDIVKQFSEDAFRRVDSQHPILFYTNDHLEHGIIWLIAGKLTEAFHRPAIVYCQHHDGKNEELHFVASCRSPDWCNLVELLDDSKDYFVRYGGHRQAAGFTITSSLLEEFQEYITRKFYEKYGDVRALPPKHLIVECEIQPEEINFETLNTIELFRPFGIGNPKPKFLLPALTVSQAQTIGNGKNHLSLSFFELPNIKCLLWNYKNILGEEPHVGDILSPVCTLSKNTWKEKESIQLILETFLNIENKNEIVNSEECVKDL